MMSIRGRRRRAHTSNIAIFYSASVVATDAPLCPHSLSRVGSRALLALSRTGSWMANGSGDYVIAFSTAESVRRTPEKSKLCLLVFLVWEREESDCWKGGGSAQARFSCALLSALLPAPLFSCLFLCSNFLRMYRITQVHH